MKSIEQRSREYARINEDKYGNTSKNFNKYDLAQAFEDGAKYS